MPNPNFTVIIDDMDLEQRYKALWYVIADGKIGKSHRGDYAKYRAKHLDSIRARDRARYHRRKHHSS